MKKQIIFLILLLSSSYLLAQNAQFTVLISKDTVLMDNIVKIEYNLKQVESKHFETPEFAHFQVVSGPNTSTSVSYINGDVTRESSYSFYLKPDSPGTWTIPAVTISTEDGQVLSTQAKDIVVLPNPEGIHEDPEPDEQHFDFFFNQPPMPARPNVPNPPSQKKKRKTYRL